MFFLLYYFYNTTLPSFKNKTKIQYNTIPPFITQYIKYNNQKKKMRSQSQNSDIQYSSNSQSSNYNGQPNMRFLQDDIQVQNNETAASFKQNYMGDGDDGSYNEVGQLFQQFYNKELLRQKQREKGKYIRLQDTKIFDKYRPIMKIYPPKPNLYFLPTTILFEIKQQKLIQLRNAIVQYYGEDANVQMSKQKQKLQQINVTIHNQYIMASYIIKSVNIKIKDRHKLPELLDQDLSLNKLFQFYQQNYSKIYKFSQICGIFIYWAYQKKLLNNDYLPQNALKLIVILFYTSLGKGIPNIIYAFKSEEKQKLDKIKSRYHVNKKFQCQLQPQLFRQTNYSLREQRSFYSQSQQKYLTMIQILPVPFPTTQQQFQKYFANLQNNPNNRQNSNRNNRQNQRQYYAIKLFFELMLFLQNSIKRTQRIIFDFFNYRKGMINISQTNFNIEIMHPIFGYNICEKLTNDPLKLRYLKQEIMNVANIYRTQSNKPVLALAKIFQKNMR